MVSDQVVLMSFCENCGSALKPEDTFCGNCGTPVAPAPGEVPAPTVKSTPLPPATPFQLAPERPAQEKNAALAAIASFLFSGLGQVYNGSFGKGLLVLVGTLIGLLIFTIPGIIVFGYGIYDAYTTARKMNEGQIPFIPHQVTHIIAFIVVGVIMVVLSIIARALIGEFMGM